MHFLVDLAFSFEGCVEGGSGVGEGVLEGVDGGSGVGYLSLDVGDNVVFLGDLEVVAGDNVLLLGALGIGVCEGGLVALETGLEIG